MYHTQSQIKHLIEQTNEVFLNYGGVNTDYADFATIALSDFKVILGTPEMTDRELKQLIRRAIKDHRDMRSQDCWTSFTARYMARKANQNIHVA